MLQPDLCIHLPLSVLFPYILCADRFVSSQPANAVKATCINLQTGFSSGISFHNKSVNTKKIF